MAGYLVEALVVERGREQCVGRLAVGRGHRQAPLLLLAGRQPVAEGLPLQRQPLVGQRALYLGRVGVALALLHPGEGQQQAVAVLLLVGQLAVDELVCAVNGATLDDALAADDAVDDVDILGRRAHLDGDGAAVAGEHVVRLVEPVVGLGGRPLVVEGEDDELLLQRVVLAGGLQRVLAALQL